MAQLTEAQKLFVVQRLAVFDTPTEVVDAVYEEFGLRVSRQAVQKYDPTVGEKPAKKWCEIFEATRKQFLENTASIPYAHRNVRLKVLQQMAQAAKARKNYVLAKDLLEQIAKEVGDYFTNTRKHSGAVLNVDFDALTDAQLEHLANGGSIETLPR